MAAKGFDAQTWTDYDGERTNMRIHVTPLTAGNFAAQAGLMATYHTKAAGLVLGVLQKNTWGLEDLVSNDKATDDAAQRELKWLISYHDAVTQKKYSAELGTADTTKLDPNDRKHAFIGDGADVDDFVTAFEAYAISEVGNAVVVDEITLVGRPL